jgi:hypothetical protein
MHCHSLTHEDLGMMQRLDILPAKRPAQRLRARNNGPLIRRTAQTAWFPVIL